LGNEASAYQRNGQVSVGIGIIPQSTANPLEMANGVVREVERLQRFLPAGAELVVDLCLELHPVRRVAKSFKYLHIKDRV
jgi:HAE1 family hydrophobic/amphiphilic exporter-1